MILCRLVVPLLLCIAFPLWSQSVAPGQNAEPVVVTVSAEAIPLSDTSASVLVLSREFLEATEATNVAEVLQQVPFLHISRTGGAGGLTTVTLRGGDPNFTLVLLDGVPVNDPTNILGGSYDFSFLSLDNVERIEIVRGPMSALFGSEAVGGVVHIISRRGSETLQLQSEADIGNFDSRHGRLSVAGAHGIARFSVSGSYQQIGEQVEGEDFELGTLAVASDFTLYPQTVLQVTSRYNDGRTEGFPENGGGPEFSILRDTKKTESRELLFNTQLFQEWSDASHATLQFDVYMREQNVDSPAILDGIPPGPLTQPPFVSDSTLDRHRLQFTQNWKIENVSLAFGGGWRGETGESTSIIADVFPSNFELQRDTGFAHSEVRFHSDRWDLNAALRADKSQDFSLELSPSLGAGYSITDRTRMRATWGEGYKLPSFFALGEPNIGNPELQPEKSYGLDAGIDHVFVTGGPKISLTYFYNSYKNLIDFSPELFRLVNRRLVTTTGAEASASWRLSRNISMDAHVAFVDSDIKNTTEKLRDRPRWRGGMHGSWDYQGTQVSAAFVRVGERFDFQIPVPQIPVAEAYNVVNLAASQEIGSALSLFVRVENLLNNRYQQFVGFPDPGRFVRFGVRFTAKAQSED